MISLLLVSKLIWSKSNAVVDCKHVFTWHSEMLRDFVMRLKKNSMVKEDKKKFKMRKERKFFFFLKHTLKKWRLRHHHVSVPDETLALTITTAFGEGSSATLYQLPFPLKSLKKKILLVIFLHFLPRHAGNMDTINA